MKKVLRLICLVGLIGSLLLSFAGGVAGHGPYDLSVVYYNCVGGGSSIWVTTNGFAEEINPIVDIEVFSILTHVIRSTSYPCSVFSLELYALEGSGEAALYFGSLLGAINITDAEMTAQYGTRWTGHTLSCGVLLQFNTEPVILQAGSNYALVMRSYTTSLGFQWETAGDYENCHAAQCLGGPPPTGIIGADLAYSQDLFLLGYWAIPTGVVTLDAYMASDGALVMGGMVLGLGSDPSVNAYIDYGVSTDFGNIQGCGSISKIGKDGRFFYNLYGIPGGWTIYYQARVVGVFSNTTGLGGVKNFTIPLVPVGFDIAVVENSIQKVVFETTVVSLGNYSSVGLNISYSDLYCDFQSNPDMLVMRDGITGAGVYNYTVAGSNSSAFDWGVTYWYKAVMTSNGTIVAASPEHTFTRYDINKSPLENWLIDWINKIGGGGGTGGAGAVLTWVWWVLAFLGFIIIWILALGGKKKHVGLGVVGSLILLGVLVVTGLISVWVVVLLATVAGGIIYALLKRAGHVGG
jgi:hypothetical protein